MQSSHIRLSVMLGLLVLGACRQSGSDPGSAPVPEHSQLSDRPSLSAAATVLTQRTPAELLRLLEADVIVVSRVGRCENDLLALRIEGTVKTAAGLRLSEGDEIGVRFSCRGVLQSPGFHGARYIDLREGVMAVVFLRKAAHGSLELEDAIRIRDVTSAGVDHLRDLVRFEAEERQEEKCRYLERWLASGDPPLVSSALAMILRMMPLDVPIVASPTLMAQVVHQLESGVDTPTRSMAASAAARLGLFHDQDDPLYERAVAALMTLMEDDDPVVSDNALVQLAGLRSWLEPDAGGYNIDGTAPARRLMPDCYRRPGDKLGCRAEFEWRSDHRAEFVAAWRKWYESGGHRNRAASDLPDSLSREQKEEMLSTITPAVRACNGRFPSELRVAASLDLEIGQSGGLTKARVRVVQPAEDTSFQHCVEESLEALRFPKSRRGARAHYVVDLTGRR